MKKHLTEYRWSEERIRSEVDNFFKYGDGKKLVQQKVIERLKSEFEQL